jgi:hypothetical protein
MSSNSWFQTLYAQQVDGPALTAAAAASALISASPAVNQGRFTFPAGLMKIGDVFRITASGRISCVVTTPGTARFDVRFGSAVVFDSQSMNLNTTAQTNVPWWLDVILTCRSIGASTNATLFGQGIWSSPAVVGSPAVSAGGSGSLVLPNSGAPAVGSGFDSTVSNTIDLFFTQTVATGSMTLHQFCLAYLT